MFVNYIAWGSSDSGVGGEEVKMEIQILSSILQRILQYITRFLLFKNQPQITEKTSNSNMADLETAKGCALVRQESRDRKYSTSRQENSDNSGKMSDFKKACRVVEAFLLNDTQLTGIRNLLDYNMRKGLCQEGSRDAKVKMLPSFVRHLPDGHENGTFVALDLGGTNFRVLLIDISDEQIEMDSQIYRIPVECMQGTGQALFDHIAKCMCDFIKRMGFAEQLIRCGFTFSFPCEQHSINSATLITWTKGFCATDVEGYDVVNLLNQALDRRNEIKVEIVAVVNDTVGTMMSCAFEDHSCQIGLIAGTGSNACYMEKLSCISKMEKESREEGRMCVNMEWGAFGDDGCLNEFITKYDDVVDEHSVNRGKQRFEKMIAGMYLGEIVRLILLDLCKQGVVFGEEALDVLETKGSFETQMVSQIVENQPRHFAAIQNILAYGELGAIKKDCEVVHMVCDAVSRRAAYMCAAGVSAIARKIHDNRPDEYLDITCGVDGSVYKKHPSFAKLLQVKTNELVGPGINVNFRLSHDGSGKGAALVTAVSSK